MLKLPQINKCELRNQKTYANRLCFPLSILVKQLVSLLQLLVIQQSGMLIFRHQLVTAIFVVVLLSIILEVGGRSTSSGKRDDPKNPKCEDSSIHDGHRVNTVVKSQGTQTYL